MAIFKKITHYKKILQLMSRFTQALVQVPLIDDLNSCYKKFDTKALSLTDASVIPPPLNLS